MKFTINGNEYEGAKFDFNTYCAFEEMNVDVSKIAEKPILAIRAYLAISTGMSLAAAGNEIESHVVNGGDLTGIMDALVKEMNNSDFFTALTGRKKSETRGRISRKSDPNTEV